jgi:hypothetical protein
MVCLSYGLRVVAERQVRLVLLHGVQPQDGVQAVQGAAEIGDIGLVGGLVADFRDEPAEAGDLVGDLGVRPAHGGGRIGAAEKPVQGPGTDPPPRRFRAPRSRR